MVRILLKCYVTFCCAFLPFNDDIVVMVKREKKREREEAARRTVALHVGQMITGSQ